MSDLFVLVPPGERLREHVISNARTGLALMRALGRVGIRYTHRTERKYVTEDIVFAVPARDFWAVRLAEKLTFASKNSPSRYPAPYLESAIELGASDKEFRKALLTVIRLSKNEKRIREFVEAHVQRKGSS